MVADLLRYAASLLSQFVGVYLLAGFCVAAFYVWKIDAVAIADPEFLAGLVLTWPAFVLMAIIFWFAAGV
jgi:hypothetical protein